MYHRRFVLSAPVSINVTLSPRSTVRVGPGFVMLPRSGPQPGALSSPKRTIVRSAAAAGCAEPRQAARAIAAITSGIRTRGVRIWDRLLSAGDEHPGGMKAWQRLSGVIPSRDNHEGRARERGVGLPSRLAVGPRI